LSHYYRIFFTCLYFVLLNWSLWRLGEIGVLIRFDKDSNLVSQWNIQLIKHQMPMWLKCGLICALTYLPSSLTQILLYGFNWSLSGGFFIVCLGSCVEILNGDTSYCKLLRKPSFTKDLLWIVGALLNTRRSVVLCFHE
jgi:hypothetical protein